MYSSFEIKNILKGSDILKKLFDKNIGDIIQEISELDDMYQGNKEHYFHVGYSALQCIEYAILLANKELTDIRKILDFPCGYGRVLRALKAALPVAQITACDLERNGVDFCERVFGVNPVYSDKNLENVIINELFDLIWVGSLFTHIDRDQWPIFLNFFNEKLNPGGILIFTTQGRYSASLLRNGQSTYGLENPDKINSLLYGFDNNGFGFSSYFHSVDYGISLASPSFVLKILEKRQNLRILMNLEKGWDNHQDVYACVKNNIG